MKMRTLVVMLGAVCLAGAAGSAVAGDVEKQPTRLTDAQMDQIVAGGTFSDTLVITSQQWFHGYSNNPAVPNSPGASLVETRTTYLRTMDCTGGSISSCYAPGQSSGLNPQTTVQSITSIGSSSSYLSGPGRSLGHRF